MNEEQCDDHHICRNGSICVSHASGNFYCDCAAAPAGAIYAGISCDHLATSFCNAQGFESITSFCTNGGACKEMVNDIASEEHAGCNCPDDYKGNYCELTVGQQVPDLLLNPNDPAPAGALAPNNNNGGGGDKKGVVIVLSALAAFLTTMVLVVVFVVRRRRLGTAHVVTSPKSLRLADSTLMDADGKVLQDSLHAASSRDLHLSQSNGSSRRMLSTSSSRDLEFTESGEEVEMSMDDIL